MMNGWVRAAALAGAAWGGAACAQEFKGAELAAEVLGFGGDGDVSQTTYRGSAEMGVLGGLGVAADLSFYDFGDDGTRNLTLHVVYDAFQFASLGAFYARDGGDGPSADSFGVEAGRSFGAAGVDGYLGFVSDDEADYRILGLDGTYDLVAGLSLTGSANVLDADEGRVSRLAIGGEYRFGRGPAVYAEVGRVNVSDDAVGFEDDETYVGLGARIAVGPNDGTTFKPRGVNETVTGF